MVTIAVPVTAATKADEAMQFEDFYRSQADRVYRALAITLTNHDLAREAADEAMTRAYMHWAKVSRHDNPGGWAYRVGLNWATSRWRRLRRESPGPALPPTADDPDTRLLAAELLARLPLPQRSVVVCRIFLELSVIETAAVLNLTEGTVKSRLSRALSTLRAALTGANHE